MHQNNLALTLFSIFLFANTIYLIKCQTTVAPATSTNIPDGLLFYYLNIHFELKI
jgi:hypothetical protein